MSKKTLGKVMVGDTHFANIVSEPSIPQQMIDTLERNLKLLESIERETGYVTSVTQRDLKILINKAREFYRG